MLKGRWRPWLLGLFALAASPAAWAVLVINSISVPTLIGNGQTVVGNVVYTRQSGSGAETVTVDIPSQLEIVAPLPAGCTLSGAAGSPQTLSCPNADPGANPGDGGSFNFSVKGLALGGGSVAATAAGSNTNTNTFSVISGGDLTVGKSINPAGTLINGQTATFTLTPAINGDSVPAGAKITVIDTLPGSASEFQIITGGVSAPGYSCNSVAAANASRQLVCSINGPLALLPVITVQGRPTLGGVGSLQNNASIDTAPVNSGDQPTYIDAVANNNTAFVNFDISPGADPRPSGSFPANVVGGSAQSLTLNYVNNGPQSTTAGQVRVAVPAGFTLGSLPAGCVNSGAGTVNGIGGTVVTCTSGTVSSGGSQSFVIPVTTPGTAQSGNFGIEIITGPAGALPGGLTDYDTGNNLGLVPFGIVDPYADLGVSKAKTAGPIAAGGTMTSDIRISNSGVAAAVYTVGGGAQPLRLVDDMSNDEEYVSASVGWTCNDLGANSAGAGQRRVVCTHDAAGTLAVGAFINMSIVTRASALLAAPIDLTNQACTGATALSRLGLTLADGPQPPDGNQNGAADCASRTSVGTPVVNGQAQVSVVKESSRDGSTWVDPVASAPTLTAIDNSMYWRFTITTPPIASNSNQTIIPTLVASDNLPAVLNLASPGPGVPAYQTPAPTITSNVLSGSAGGSCSPVLAGQSQLNCSFTNVAPGTTIQVVVRVDRPIDSGSFTNSVALSSPNALLTASAGGQLNDDAALVIQGRSDPAVMSKTASPPNSANAPRVGQSLSFTIVARNLGPNDITGPMTVTDTVDPTRFVLLSATATGGTGAPAMTCTITPATGLVSCATLGATSVRRYDFYTISIATRVLKPAPLPAPILTVVNSATVALDPAQNCESLSSAAFTACNDAASTSNNSASASVDIRVPLVDLISKKSRVLPGTQTNFGFGDMLRYRFRAQNGGAGVVSRAENVHVTDRITAPPGYTVTLVGVASVNNVGSEPGFTRDDSKTAATVSCTQAGANADVECILAGGANNFLGPNTEVNFELTFTLVGAPAVVSLSNAALVCADETLSGNESNGSCSFIAAGAGNNLASVSDLIFPKTDLAITKTRVTPSPVSINQPVEYSLGILNRGGNETTQIRFTDVLPPNFEWVTGAAFTPAATPGAFAGLSVSALACTASPASIAVAGQQQTLSCVLDGNFPGNVDASNVVAVRLYARPKQGFFTGPYLSDRSNAATVSPGLDGVGQPLSLDTNPTNNSASALVQVQNTSLAGTVFEDRVRDGSNAGTPQLAASEPRIPGGGIRLTGTDLFGYPVNLTATVDGSGNYSFANLAPANAAGYLVEQVAQPAGFVNSPSPTPASGADAPSVGGTYAPVGTNGTSSYTAVQLAGGDTGVRYNFPEVRRPDLSGYVYRDANQNGTRDAATDPAIANATVQLLNATTGVVLQTTTTDASGFYSFTSLDPLVTYSLREPLPAAPAGLVNGAVNPGLIGGAACGAGCTAVPAGTNTGDDRINNIDLSSGADGTQFNFGEVQNGGISGVVWLDANRNGTLDGTEPVRLAGVTINLVQGMNCAGPVYASMVTAANGTYGFIAAPGLAYTICQVQPTGYGNGGVSPGTAAAANGVNAITIASLPLGGSPNNNFGETLGSVAGSVYLDANNDGDQQPGETGFAGITVTLTGRDVNGAPVSRSTTTDASGNYRFDDLLAAGPGGYTVTEQVAQPVSGTVTTLNGRTTAGTIAGTQTGAGSPVAALPSRISGISLPPGGDSINNRFGEILPVSLSGTVFMDPNDNGLFEPPNDTALPGVTVVVTGIDDTGAAIAPRTLITDAAGHYAVNDLRPGQYTVTEPVQPAGSSNGKTVPGSTGGTATVQASTPSVISAIPLFTPGSSSVQNNFAEIPSSSALEGRVWLDDNNNGLIDGSETGIAGVTIELTGVDVAGKSVTRSTTTDANGNYRFSELSPGTYRVLEPAQPADTANGITVPGTLGGTATPVATTPSALSGIVLGAAQVSSVNNFGEVPAADIRGWVYSDNNNNGLFDAGETGLPNVPLVLTGTDDLGNPVSLSGATGPDGRYAFTNLRPGTYTVTEPTQPPATANGITTPGTLGGSATPVAVTPSVLAGIPLPMGGHALENNFGEVNDSPDLRVSKSLVQARFTVGLQGGYSLSVRNAGKLASTGVYTVYDRLPAGLTLAATPSGPGWACVGAVGASSFSCTSSSPIAAETSLAQLITATVNVAPVAEANSPVNNAVMVDGGGELEARRPTAPEREAFNNNPAALPVCTPAIQHNVCRTPTPVQQPASLSGTVWFDGGPATRFLDPGDKRLPGWIVEVIDPATGKVVGTATTGPDGTYRVINLEPGVPLVVRFRDPNSGIVYGYPVNGETAPGSSGANCEPANASLGKASSCEGKPSYQPQLTVVLVAGRDLPQQSLPVDPSGVVYDSGSRLPVPGSVVTLAPVGACSGWNPAVSLVGGALGGYTLEGGRASMTVGPDGYYQFLFGTSAPARCTFSLTVTPPVDSGYIAPSALIPPTSGPLAPTSGPGTTYAVQPQPTPPTGPVGPATIYYLTLDSGSGMPNIVHNHLPLDAVLPSALAISKTGDKAVVEVGDTVRYTITVMVPSGALPHQTTVLDRLPPGFTYIPGTAMLDDTRLADPQGGLGPLLAFTLGRMPESRQLVLHYRVRVGVGAQQGDGVNRAQGHACSVAASCVDASLQPRGGALASNQAAYRVRVGGGVFTTDACVLGKVYVDCNGNQVQDPEELGIPGVRLVMQDGTTLITDSEGKYSQCGLLPRSAVMRIDPLTLPRGSRLVTSSSRNLGDAGSLWLDLKNGELHRADFIEGSCSNSVLEQTKARRAQGEVRAPETEKKGAPALRFDSKAHGKTPFSSPQEGTEGATQRLPKPRVPAPLPPGTAEDEANVPTPDLPMNRPAPVGRDSATATDAGAQHGAR